MSMQARGTRISVVWILFSVASLSGFDDLQQEHRRMKSLKQVRKEANKPKKPLNPPAKKPTKIRALPVANLSTNPLLSAESRHEIGKRVGVYGSLSSFQNPQRQAEIQNTILITTANYGYRQMLMAWMCRVRELGLKFVVHAQDLELYSLLRNSSAKDIFGVIYESSLSAPVGFLKFGSKEYTRVTCIKISLIRGIMEEMGHNVWMTDPDTAFIADPLPWFHWGGSCDYEYMQSYGPRLKQGVSALVGGAIPSERSGNTGFVLWRASPAAVKIVRACEITCLTQDRAAASGSQRFNFEPGCS